MNPPASKIRRLDLVVLRFILAAAAGVFRAPWRPAYYQMLLGMFERVYRIGRGLSVLVGLTSIILVFLIGREMFAGGTGPGIPRQGASSAG